MAGHERQAEIDSGPSALAGEAEEFALRFEGCRRELSKLCRRILQASDGAEDAVQHTYLRAYASRSRFDGVNFPGWVARIAQHICIDVLRARWPSRELEDGRGFATTHDEMRLVNAIQIRNILRGLPDQQRICLKLFYLEGYSAKEVAKRTGFTEKQVKSHLQNGRRNFVLAWNAVDKGSK
jgi:RNA polymerase sigma-70 factor (ECF subfamily)